MKVRYQRKRYGPLGVTIVFVLVTLSLTMTYVSGTLNGKFDHIFLPAKMFGVPDKVSAHGFTPLFKDDQTGGWDGQFYFYIANDPLALGDTIKHVDADAYRYQRIGLPLLAYFASKISGQDWVNPWTYYLTNLVILTLATLLGASFLSSRGMNPSWILLWALGMGPQITQLHGLPDGAADGLLIIALVCLLSQRKTLYTIAITFAALSREVYILVPCGLILAEALLNFRERDSGKTPLSNIFTEVIKRQWYQAVPLAAFLAWQIFIRIRFNLAPSDQAFGILGFPFKASLEYMLAPVTGVREWNKNSRVEMACILLFLTLLTTTACCLVAFLRRHCGAHPVLQAGRVTQLGIVFPFLPIVALYFCFGSTVMMDKTGYWKAANIFLFVIPFLAALQYRRVGVWARIISFSCFILFGLSFLWHVNSATIASESIKYASSQPACLKRYAAHIKPVSIEIPRSSWWQRLSGNTQVWLEVEISNTGEEDFLPYGGKGGIAASYQWINVPGGSVAKDGLRTSLRDRLAPGETVRLPIRIEPPKDPANYLLKISLVQEDCKWFYMADPSNSFDVDYTIR